MSEKSNQELIEESVGGTLEVSRELETFSKGSETAMREYYCMDCRIGNTETGEEAVCESCAYM